MRCSSYYFSLRKVRGVVVCVRDLPVGHEVAGL